MYDEVITIENDDAFTEGRAFARSEGILVGISSGAALKAAAILAARPENKGGKIVLIVILILLIWFLIYFIVRFGAFVYNPAQETTAAEEGTKVAQTYDAYSNPHKITTTPDYSIADAKLLLKQTIHDNWQEVGYSADPSSSSISYNNKVVTVNGADCYVFSCSGKTFAVAVKLSAVYYAHNGEYQPLTFNNTNYLFK